MYLTLKAIHISCVVISITGFTVRGILALRGSAVLQRRWLRIVPHVNDTVLLASALGMAALSAQYPFVTPWLTAKVSGLIAYILLGVVTLRAGRWPFVQRAAFAASLLIFAWIVSVALTRHPGGIFALLGGSL